MFHVEINGQGVYEGYDGSAAWELYGAYLPVIEPGDEIVLYLNDELEAIETRFLPGPDCGIDGHL